MPQIANRKSYEIAGWQDINCDKVAVQKCQLTLGLLIFVSMKVVETQIFSVGT